MSASTRESTSQGLVSNHAYTVIHTYVLSNGARVMKLRNPQGKNEWAGKYADNDPYWAANPSDADLVGLKKDNNDGTFMISVEDFREKGGKSLFFNYDPTGWHHSYWLGKDNAD